MIQTRTQYLELFENTQDAVAFEETCLQAGREFLPPCAHAVRAGLDPTPAYWQWLAGQKLEADRDQALGEDA